VTKPRVLVAIAHPAIAAGVCDLLRSDARYEVARVTPAEVEPHADDWQPDLVLADAGTARGIPGALRPRVLVAAVGDGINAGTAARAIGAKGWVFADDVAAGVARHLPGRPMRPAARARAVTSAVGARVWALTMGIAALALRLTYLRLGTDDAQFTGWYTDSFHHWQIAYLSKEIGASQGPRLWDLGGVEYFWGFLPTVLDALLLAVTFSTALWPLQGLNLAAGAATVGVLYRVGRRYWSHRAGLVLALFVAANPVSVFVDASAMQEPVAFLFLALALLWFLDRPGLAGVMLGLAALSRPDYWIYSLALIASATAMTGELRARPPFVALGAARPYLVGWVAVMTPYVLHLWLQTGNPIYPVWWNFLGNARGAWLADVQPNEAQRLAQWIGRGLLAGGVAGHAFLIWRRPAGWPVFAAGLWGCVLIGLMLGISKYVLAYLERFWIDRIMLLLFLLIAALLAVGATWIERKLNVRRFALGTAAALTVVLALNALWLPTLHYRDQQRGGYDAHMAFGARAGALMSGTEGRVAVPGAAVFFTYSLVQHGVEGQRLLSTVYHPDYSAQAPEEFMDWLLNRWQVRWLVIARDDAFWDTVVATQPRHFQRALDGVLSVYEVRP
jgi:hypothetical protein